MCRRGLLLTLILVLSAPSVLPAGAVGLGPPDVQWAPPSSGIGGAARYQAGEWIHTDFVYDDGGAAGNTADIAQVQVRELAGDLAVRVTLNSLHRQDQTVLGLASEQASAPLRPWPLEAGVSSRWTRFATVADGHVILVDPDQTVLALGIADVDVDANTVDFLLPGWGTRDVVSLVIGSGVWEADAWSWGSDVLDLAFNSGEPATGGNTWRRSAQSAAIDSGDVSGMAQTIDLTALRAGATIPHEPGPGTHVRVFPTRQDLGEGVRPTGSAVQYTGKFQPYTLHLPSGHDPGAPAPLNVVLHSLGQTHGQYVGSNVYRHVGDDLGAIAVTPLALGTSGWYWDEALVDTLEVLLDVVTHYSVDPDRIATMGYSMGGYGTYRLATLLPELFSTGISWVGPPAHQIWAYPLPPMPPGARSGPGTTYHQLENTLHIPFFIVHGTNDELVPVTGVLHQSERFRELGHTYRFNLHPGQDHISFMVIDDWTRERTWLRDRVRVGAPARVALRIDPDAWVTSDRPAAQRAAVLADLHGVVADLGVALTGAYWVSGVQIAAGEIAAIDLESHGVAARLPQTEDVLTAAVGPQLPHVVRGLDRTYSSLPEENVLSGTLSGVDAVTIDLVAAGLQLEGLEVRVTSDRPVTLHLVQGSQSDVTVVAAGPSLAPARALSVAGR